MIFGIGTDIVAIARIAEMHQRHPVRTLDKLLAPMERNPCLESTAPNRFLAKRFAAKEAFGKALGTGIRAPALLTAMAVIHDPSGKPSFTFDQGLSDFLNARGLAAHLSISDEQDYALAFVILEQL